MMRNMNDDNDDDRNNSSNKYFMSTATTTTTTTTIIDDTAAAVPAAIPAAAYRGSSSFTSIVSDENGSCGGGDGGGGGGGGSSVDTDSNYNNTNNDTNNNTNKNTNKNTTNLKRRHDRCDDQEDGTLTEDDDEYKSNRTSNNNSQGTGTTAAASTAANEISSLTQRLNKMSVRDRENATFDLHGIPLDDEYFDASTNDIHIQNNIEKDPAKLELLLDELDHYVNELLIEHEKEKKVDGLKKTIGIGLHMAKQQDSNYVYNQRIKFLRADRYDTKLGAERMIRFFDLKKEFFCDNGYNNNNIRNNRNNRNNSSNSSNSNSNSNNNNNNNVDSNNYDCLGRDLRLSDFSVQDLRLWKQSGFFQLCGMRDRAKRAIVCIFGKALSDYKIDPSLVSRAYLYCCNVWSRDESIQKAGMVVIGYSALTEFTPQNDRNIDSNGIFGEYIKNSDPLLGQIVKVGMSGHLRGVARHFCYDHPLLHIQFEKLASHMSSFSAARFRCHYANPTEHSSNSNNITFNPHKELLYILMTFGIPRQTIPINENTGKINVEFHQAILDAIDEREKQDVINNIDNNVDSNYNIDNNVDLDNNNNSIVMSSDQQQQQHQQKQLNNGAAIEESLWMSLTASISTTTNSSISNMSFSLFPELLKEDDDNNDMSTSFFNDGNDDDDGGDGGGGALTDINITNNENNGMIMATAAAAVPATRMSSIYPTDYDVNNTDGPDRINTDGIIEVLRPKSKDIIMGKGQWNKFHPGNIAFKLSLNNEREQYELANRFERMRVVDRMLNELLGIKKHLGGKTSTPSTPLSPSSSSSSVAAAATANNVVGGGGNGARFLYKEKKKKITATSSDNASKDTAQEARTNHSEDNNHRNDNNQNDDNDKQQQYEQQQLSLLFDAGPWLIATREKAHDKITHDFRNMRRQTQLQQQQQQHFL